MNHDIFEQIPQGSRAPQDEENVRIASIADELERVCRIHASQSGDGSKDVLPLELEQSASERWAKDNCCWVPMTNILDLGYPGPSGNENDTYVDKNDNVVYKVNNLFNSGSIITHLRKMVMHNNIFPETAYSFYGFAGIEGRSVLPIFKQKWVVDSRPATQIMIDTYMAAIGFENAGYEGRFKNRNYEVWDLLPRNVLVDGDGDIYVVDAEVKHL